MQLQYQLLSDPHWTTLREIFNLLSLLSFVMFKMGKGDSGITTRRLWCNLSPVVWWSFLYLKWKVLASQLCTEICCLVYNPSKRLMKLATQIEEHYLVPFPSLYLPIIAVPGASHLEHYPLPPSRMPFDQALQLPVISVQDLVRVMLLEVLL